MAVVTLQFLTITEKAAINIFVHDFWWTETLILLDI